MQLLLQILQLASGILPDALRFHLPKDSSDIPAPVHRSLICASDGKSTRAAGNATYVITGVRVAHGSGAETFTDQTF